MMIASMSRVPSLLCLPSLAVAAAAQAPVDFDRDVRPLLADRCFRCHGPDAGARKGKLRLDQEAAAKAPRGERRPAIVAASREGSELWHRIGRDDDDRMPPKDSGLSLSAAERALLGRWIDGGAKYAPHWAFVPPPDEVAVPAVVDAAWVRNPIDAFVRARLGKEGLAPAAPAPRARLLRRATFALTGLPPTPDEVLAFEADTRPDAFARVVERLLAAEAYGERMAVDWLDAARYADTYGYQSDVYRAVWPWRDWVVSAFQHNVPFDRFLTEQLAGDLLPNASREQILATCFNRLHRQTNEGGSVEEEFRVAYVCDRVETFGSAMLGLSVGCARCHDHKFDPVTQREFYALTACFDDIDESGLYSHFTDAVPTPTLMLPTPAQEKALAAVEEEVQAAKARLRWFGDPCPQEYYRWLEGPRGEPDVVGCVAHYPLDAIEGGKVANLAQPDRPGEVGLAPAVVPGRIGNALRFDGENSLTLRGVADFDAYHPFTIALWLRVDAITERTVVLHRSRAWTDAASRGYELILEDGRPSFALIHFWPGDAARIRAVEPLVPGRWTHLAVMSGGWGCTDALAILVDGKPAKVEVVRDSLTKTITGGGADALIVGARFRDRGLAGGEVDDLRVYARTLASCEVDHVCGGHALERLLAAPHVESESLDDLHGYWMARHKNAWSDDEASLLAALRKRGAIRDQIQEIMVMRDDCPRTAYVLARGAYDQRREAVDPGVPASLPPWPKDAPQNRLGLAQWLTDPRHPLTARVVVNRIWQMHFGQGLVRTQEDFGVQGARPSHPDLLDWLARWFVRSGWDVHALHKLILTSATWQQDSRTDAALRGRDPDNELLARGPALRLTAEMLRDAALFASDLLVDKRGGPPVKPYQPPGLWEEKSGATYKRDEGEGSHRRSLYTFWKRTSPPPAMTLFDAPDREVCIARRTPTSTPLQALVLMNDPQFVEAARGLAARELRTHGADVDACVRAMHVRVLSVPPDPATLTALTTLWRTQAATFASRPADAQALLAVGDLAQDPSLDPATLAAATLVASALFASDEAVVLR